jgi:2-polyprenyl-6-methoxyphenol hydroxylase-like FAD-dependent oxidoreductase
VLTAKKVVDIRTNKHGVEVITSDGSIYDGDVVVGADGVNSTVRRCMWKDVTSKNPTLVAKESTGDIAAPYTLWLC